MPGQRRYPGPRRLDPAAEARVRGLELVQKHALFAPLAGRVSWRAEDADAVSGGCPASGWAVVSSTGTVTLHPRRRGTPEEWAWVAAHCLTHLGFGHLDPRRLPGWTAAAGAPRGADFDPAWNLAACLTVNRFLAHLKLGRPPDGIGQPARYDHLVAAAGGDEEEYAARLRGLGIQLDLAGTGTAGPERDLRWEGQPRPSDWRGPADWPGRFATGLSAAVGAAVSVAGGEIKNLTGDRGRKTEWHQALDWFISNYPLLGAMADAFTLIEDADVCRRHGIAVAAISPGAAELYVNPRWGPREAGEYRFVIAHELLHAGLRHDTRSGGRDPFLWNVACDYVINGWLTEMEVGDSPGDVLYDVSLRGLSAEEVYDQLATGGRRLRKLATLRGPGLPDVLPRPLSDDPRHGVDLDEFYRRCLADGIDYHRRRGRGLLPAGLVQEIRALGQPPVPWDVELARWFDHHFPPLERRRSYARSSRRQAATPDIPRPGWYLPPELAAGRTFGVVLDTSGSMSAQLLGKALGAVASYAVSRDVPVVRVVFCDAEAHDNGWMAPPDMAGRVRVRGRGGTVLQPGVDLLQEAADFPKGGPILVITDGWCDRVRIQREHAFLIPAGAVLPFAPRGPVFRFS
jgi:predicted metal-dependent peptidase